MARRGARFLAYGGDRPDSASEEWRAAAARAGRDWEPEEVWVEETGTEQQEPSEAGGAAPAAQQPEPPAARRGPSPDRKRPGSGAAPAPGGPAGEEAHRHNVPRPVVDELAAAAGSVRGPRLAARLADATHAYDRERYQEARRILRPIAEEVPDALAVQELYGLTLYRMGQWAQAAKHLELYKQGSGSYDQHPVLADCYRALRRYPAAEGLWDELREASPSADLVAEGRIVAAGCRADQGDLAGAIALLERSARRVERPQDRHVRQWYALADLYERAGDLPRARDLFRRVAAADAEAFDVRQRLKALR